jgi:hypothetical protein
VKDAWAALIAIPIVVVIAINFMILGHGIDRLDNDIKHLQPVPNHVTPRPTPSRASRSRPLPASKPGRSRPRTVSSPVPARAGGLNWYALRQCESGGDYTQVSRTGKFRGAYQFSRSTWATVGPPGDPAAASPAEQDRRAALLYARDGRSPWPFCGRFL